MISQLVDPQVPSMLPEQGQPWGLQPVADPQKGRKEHGRAEEMQTAARRHDCCGCAAAVEEETPFLQPAQSNLACLGTPELI